MAAFMVFVITFSVAFYLGSEIAPRRLCKNLLTTSKKVPLDTLVKMVESFYFKVATRKGLIVPNRWGMSVFKKFPEYDLRKIIEHQFCLYEADEDSTYLSVQEQFQRALEVDRTAM